ncbi:hypothetical protein RFI_27930, partial [Reticulomyxa filosa]
GIGIGIGIDIGRGGGGGGGGGVGMRIQKKRGRQRQDDERSSSSAGTYDSSSSSSSTSSDEGSEDEEEEVVIGRGVNADDNNGPSGNGMPMGDPSMSVTMSMASEKSTGNGNTFMITHSDSGITNASALNTPTGMNTNTSGGAGVGVATIIFGNKYGQDTTFKKGKGKKHVGMQAMAKRRAQKGAKKKKSANKKQNKMYRLYKKLWREWQANDDALLAHTTIGTGFEMEMDHLLQEFSDESENDDAITPVTAAGGGSGSGGGGGGSGASDNPKMPEEMRWLKEMMSSQNKWTQEEINEKLERLQDQRKLKKLLQKDKLKDNMQNLREQRQNDHRAVIIRRQKHAFNCELAKIKSCTHFMKGYVKNRHEHSGHVNSLNARSQQNEDLNNDTDVEDGGDKKKDFDSGAQLSASAPASNRVGGGGGGNEFDIQEWNFETMLLEMYELQLLRNRQRIKAEKNFRNYRKKTKYRDEKRTQPSYYDYMMKSYELQTYTIDSEEDEMIVGNRNISQSYKHIYQKKSNVVFLWDWNNRHCVTRFEQIRKMIVSMMRELGVIRIDVALYTYTYRNINIFIYLYLYIYIYIYIYIFIFIYLYLYIYIYIFIFIYDLYFYFYSIYHD